MEKKIIYRMSSPYRDEFRITGYEFGEGEKTVAIIGAMRGDEIQQQYVCAQIVKRLMKIENDGKIDKGCKILVIPNANPFSMNLEKRFWSMDNTDINRMFPGYDKGETTQRIAAALFDTLKNYTYGIQLASFYMPGEFVPHVRMLDTGYQDTADARFFELPYIYVRKPRPYDSTMLNYNWQIWNTFAFSIYSGLTNQLNTDLAEETIHAIFRFMNSKRIVNDLQRHGYVSEIVTDDNHVVVRSKKAGIYTKLVSANHAVEKGDLLARIIDPYNGDTLDEILSPCKGIVFFAHYRPLVLEDTIIFRIIEVKDTP